MLLTMIHLESIVKSIEVPQCPVHLVFRADFFAFGYTGSELIGRGEE